MLLNFSKPKYYYLFICIILFFLTTPCLSGVTSRNEFGEENRGRLDFWENITGEPGQWKLETGISKYSNNKTGDPWGGAFVENGFRERVWIKLEKYFKNDFFISFTFPKERKIDNTLNWRVKTSRSVEGTGNMTLEIGKTFQINNNTFFQIYCAKKFEGTFSMYSALNTGNRNAGYLLGGIWHHKYKNFGLTLNYQYTFYEKIKKFSFSADEGQFIGPEEILDPADIGMIGILLEYKLSKKANIGFLAIYENETTDKIFWGSNFNLKGGERWSNGILFKKQINKKIDICLSFINQTEIRGFITEGNYIELKFIKTYDKIYEK